MKSRLATLFVIISFLSSCSYQEIMDEKMSVDSPDVINEFHASFSETEAGVDSLETKTYIEEDSQSSRLNLYWNEDDRISVFCGNTLNQQYRFDGETGDNSGTFKLIAADENVSYNPLDTPTNIAYYPYDENTEISEDGALVVNFPETQYYAENSFGPGANAMVAVTENPDDLDLKFKNVGGYLKFRFYFPWNSKTIKSVTLKGNNGEKIAGKASLTFGYGEEPAIEMSNDATDAITINCGDGISIGKWHDVSEVEIWFVLPPVKFTQGFTITVTDSRGMIFTKTTEKLFEIKRNTIKPISTIEMGEFVDDVDAIAKERAALIELFNSTGGENWTYKTNWCSDKPISEWYGVDAVANRVQRLFLDENNLVGSLPEGVGELKMLKILDMNGNQLSGSIPESIGNLANLVTLDLRDNILTGNIPESISLLKNLENLELGKLKVNNPNYNSFTGNIPKNIGNLQKLTKLEFSSFQLTGSIPESIRNMDKLEVLNLGNNQLEGTLPECLSDMTSLTTLDLANNDFTGEIPENIGNLTNLTSLALAENELTGVLPESMSNLVNLNYLTLMDNHLSGRIPESVINSKPFKDWWHKILPGNDFEETDILGPDFLVKDIYGNIIESSSEYINNKLTVLFLWGSWCSISKAYVVTLNKLYERYRHLGLEIIGQFHGGLTDASRKKYGIEWKCMTPVADQQEIIADASVFPSVIAIDNNRKVVFSSFVQDIVELVSFVNDYFSYSPSEDMYTSTDYSKDGDVVTLQEASAGIGINLIFMGEAFVDKDMESGGLYEQKMKEGMELFFSVEPYKSLRNRFNVYAVKVVSPNAEFDVEGAVHRINMDESVCFEYASLIPGADKNPPMVTVIYNTWQPIMRSRCRMYTDGGFVSYIMNTMVEGASTIPHESGGHGFANLLDEYIEPGNESKSLPDYGKEYLDNLWDQYGYGVNVDWRNDKATVKWAHFLNDSRYADEGLGIYEGAYLYGYGAYRPSYNSIMKGDSDVDVFNAPSREQIYKRVMQLSEGPDWVYDYEEFVAFDAPNRTAASAPATKSASVESRNEHMRNHQPPTIIEGSWRDELEGR